LSKKFLQSSNFRLKDCIAALSYSGFLLVVGILKITTETRSESQKKIDIGFNVILEQ
jgi:hypothetical protein